MSQDVVSLYEQSLKRRGFVSDSSQWRAVERLQRLHEEWTEYKKKRSSGRIHTPYYEHEIQPTPPGTLTKYLNDRAIGNQASGLTQVKIQFAPGKTQ